MPVTFTQLSKADQRRLRSLANALGVPFRFVSSREALKKLLREDQAFSNTDVVHKDGVLIFAKDEDVHTVCHDIGHALFLGPLYKCLQNGVSDLADQRWKGEEEGVIMALQCYIADACLYNYGGAKQMVKCMDEFGYGFGNEFSSNSTPAGWLKHEIKKEHKKIKKLRQYKALRVYTGADWGKKLITITN